MASTADLIIAQLNSDAAFDNGLSCRDARLDGSNVVTFTYPAPVISGACVGLITIHADGSIHDDTSDDTFPTFDAWLDELNSMMEV